MAKAKVVHLPHDTTTPLRMVFWNDAKIGWKAQFEIKPGKAYECPHTHWTEHEALRCHRRLVRFMTRDPRWQPQGATRPHLRFRPVLKVLPNG